MPQGDVMASPEQACCDYVYICRKRGVSASSLVSFRNMDRINRQTLAKMLTRYPAAVRREVVQLLAGE